MNPPVWRRAPFVRLLVVLVVLVGLVVVVLPGAGAATGPLPPDVERSVVEYVEHETAALEVPGAAVAVVRGDEIVFARGFGTADDDGEPATPQTSFDIASVSKSLTALAVMQQIEAGRFGVSHASTSCSPSSWPAGRTRAQSRSGI